MSALGLIKLVKNDNSGDVAKIKAFVDAPHWPVSDSIDMIVITIDPSGSGSGNWGICACYYDAVNDMQLILQTDTIVLRHVTPSVLSTLILRVINHIRGLDAVFEDPPMLIVCENTPLMVGSVIYECVQQKTASGEVKNVVVMCEFGSDKKPGVPRTRSITRNMITCTSGLMRDGRIRFSEHYASFVVGRSVGEAKAKFFEELATFDGAFEGIAEKNYANMYSADEATTFCMQYYWYRVAMTSKDSQYWEIHNYSHAWRTECGRLLVEFHL
jgi:hypothetical protein